MVRVLKQATRHRENPQHHLTMTKKKDFNDYWSNLYHDDDEIGYNPKVIADPPGRDKIKYVVDHLPMRKAPGPDQLTAELLKYGEGVTFKMTTTLVELI